MPWTCQIQAERSIEEDGKARNLVQRCQEAKVILSLASGIVSYSFDVFLSDCWLYNVLCTLISTISSISTTSSLNLYVLQTSTNIYTSFSDFVGIRWSAMEEACAPSWGATFLLGTAPTTGTIRYQVRVPGSGHVFLCHLCSNFPVQRLSMANLLSIAIR